MKPAVEDAQWRNHQPVIMAKLRFIRTTLAIFVLLCSTESDVYKASKDWSRRPGTVYVCEGETAQFEWDYDSTGQFKMITFFKIRPVWKFIFEKHRHQNPVKQVDRITFIENSTLRLQHTLLSDSGKYEIEVYLDHPNLLYYDLAELQVLSTSACPHRIEFKHPPIYLDYPVEEDLGRPFIYNNTRMDLRSSQNIALQVDMPAADPPVECSITINKGVNLGKCTGATDSVSICEVELDFSNEEYHQVDVTLQFIALGSSTTTFFVRVLGNQPDSSTIVTTEAISLENHYTTVPLIMKVVFGALCSLLIGGLVSFGAFLCHRQGRLCFKPEPNGTSTEDPPSSNDQELAAYRQQESHPSSDTEEITPLLPIDTFGLHEAVIFGHIDSVRNICAKGVDLNIPGVLGLTPLQLATEYGHVGCIEFLVAYGAKVNMPGRDFSPPLLRAAEKGQLEMVKLFCTFPGMDINKCGLGNKTALHLACFRRHVDIVDFLVEKGASLSIKDDEGKTPQFGRYDIAYHLAYQTAYKQSEKYDCMEAMHAAVYEGDITVLDYLLKKGVDVLHLTDHLGQNTLDLAKSQGNVNVFKFLQGWSN